MLDVVHGDEWIEIWFEEITFVCGFDKYALQIIKRKKNTKKTRNNEFTASSISWNYSWNYPDKMDR